MTRPARSPDIAELRAFCLAVGLGSIGRAAIALRISQPALSKRLRALESMVGTPLLERSPTGVTPTAAGRRLYPEARRLLDQADALSDLIGGLGGDEEPLRIAVSHTVAEFHLPPELVAYQTGENRQQRALELTVCNSREVRRLVGEGRAELGIVGNRLPDDPADKLEELDVIDDEVVLAVPRSHPWQRRRTIPRAEFLRTPLIVRDPGAHSRRLIDAVLTSRRLRLAPPLREVGSTAAAKREALELRAPILLSALALARGDGLVRRPIEELRFPRRFVLLTRSLADLRPSERELVTFLRRRKIDVMPTPPAASR